MSQCQELTTDDYHAYDERITYYKGVYIYPCPCKYCNGGKVKKRDVIY